MRFPLGDDTTDPAQFGETLVSGYNALMTTTTTGRPPTRFRSICPHINQAYGDLRNTVRAMGYVDESKGPRGSSIEQYALGFIREIAAAHLSKEKVQGILSRFSDRKI